MTGDGRRFETENIPDTPNEPSGNGIWHDESPIPWCGKPWEFSAISLRNNEVSLGFRGCESVFRGLRGAFPNGVPDAWAERGSGAGVGYTQVS